MALVGLPEKGMIKQKNMIEIEEDIFDDKTLGIVPLFTEIGDLPPQPTLYGTIKPKWKLMVATSGY